jgi:uncharacterized membrane protein YkoI
MARLCEALLEPWLKRLFIGRSAFVQDNQVVKNTRTTTNTLLTNGPWAAWAILAILATLAVCAAVGHGNALASDKGDHERALQAVQSGQVLPLAKVLALVEKAHPGQVLEVELENHKQQWHYEIKLLQPDGRLMKLQVDARTGEVLKRKKQPPFSQAVIQLNPKIDKSQRRLQCSISYVRLFKNLAPGRDRKAQSFAEIFGRRIPPITASPPRDF